MSEILVIRIRGSSQTRQTIEDTLTTLKLYRTNSACLIPDSRKGMMQSIKDYVAYGEVSDAFAKELKTLMNGEKTLRLNPPVKGYTSIKIPYPKGSLGNWGNNIEELARRMLRTKEVAKEQKTVAKKK